jgi:hypothetical protein
MDIFEDLKKSPLEKRRFHLMVTPETKDDVERAGFALGTAENNLLDLAGDPDALIELHRRLAVGMTKLCHKLLNAYLMTGVMPKDET